MCIRDRAGYGLLAGQGSSFGMLILKLKPWDERPGDEDNVQSVIGQVYAVSYTHLDVYKRQFLDQVKVAFQRKSLLTTGVTSNWKELNSMI